MINWETSRTKIIAYKVTSIFIYAVYYFLIRIFKIITITIVISYFVWKIEIIELSKILFWRQLHLSLRIITCITIITILLRYNILHTKLHYQYNNRILSPMIFYIYCDTFIHSYTFLYILYFMMVLS